MNFPPQSPFLDSSCGNFDEMNHTRSVNYPTFPVAPPVAQEDIHELLGSFQISLSIESPQRTQSNPQMGRDLSIKKRGPKKKKTEIFPISPALQSKIKILPMKNSVSFPSNDINSPIKRVATPEWQLVNSKNNSVYNSTTIHFDLTHAHKLLEMMEERIVSGTLAKYAHPAQVTLAAQEVENPNWTPKELEVAEHYEEKYAERVRPTFWEPRAWDAAVLSEGASAHLKEEMEKGESGIYFQMHPKKPARAPRKSSSKSPSRTVSTDTGLDSAMFLKRKRGRPRKYDKQGLRITEVRLPIPDFITDDEDNGTDWEDL